MVDSVLLYLSFGVLLVALVSLIRPITFLYLRTRLMAAMVAMAAVFTVIVILSLPARTQQVAIPTTRLDHWMPAWQFGEKHLIRVHASPENVFAAIRQVRANEILFFQTLTAIRRCGRAGPESILDAPEQKPILDVATQTTFVVLSDDSPHELVLGTVIIAPLVAGGQGKLSPEIFRKVMPPGVALATMNFLVTPDKGGGSIVSTETRVSANNSSAVRRFAVYWRIIHPGSDIIRRMWLRAIRGRAEDPQGHAL
jgi:hypothetical protein